MSLSPRTECYQIANTPLDDLLLLPNDLAAVALDSRMKFWDEIDRLQVYSYAERGMICRVFERRMLWQYLVDPLTGEMFASFTKWMASGFTGCRSVNYESMRDMNELADVPAGKLREISKGGIKILKQLSGSVRKQDDVLEAARTLSPDAFMAKLEIERPEQHIEAKGPMRFTPTASQRVVIEQAIQKAIDDGAHDRTEALEFVCVDYCIGRIPQEEVADGAVS